MGVGETQAATKDTPGTPRIVGLAASLLQLQIGTGAPQILQDLASRLCSAPLPAEDEQARGIYTGTDADADADAAPPLVLLGRDTEEDSPRPSRPSLDALPADVLGAVAAFACPVDAAALRQSCYAASQVPRDMHRTVYVRLDIAGMRTQEALRHRRAGPCKSRDATEAVMLLGVGTRERYFSRHLQRLFPKIERLVFQAGPEACRQGWLLCPGLHSFPPLTSLREIVFDMPCEARGLDEYAVTVRDVAPNLRRVRHTCRRATDFAGARRRLTEVHARSGDYTHRSNHVFVADTQVPEVELPYANLDLLVERLRQRPGAAPLPLERLGLLRSSGTLDALSLGVLGPCYPSLTRLALHAHDGSVLLGALLQALPGLRSLRLSLATSGARAGPDRPDPLHAEHLEELFLQRYPVWTAPHQVRLPRLRRLELRLVPIHGEATLKALMANATHASLCAVHVIQRCPSGEAAQPPGQHHTQGQEQPPGPSAPPVFPWGVTSYADLISAAPQLQELRVERTPVYTWGAVRGAALRRLWLDLHDFRETALRLDDTQLPVLEDLALPPAGSVRPAALVLCLSQLRWLRATAGVQATHPASPEAALVLEAALLAWLDPAALACVCALALTAPRLAELDLCQARHLRQLSAALPALRRLVPCRPGAPLSAPLAALPHPCHPRHLRQLRVPGCAPVAPVWLGPWDMMRTLSALEARLLATGKPETPVDCARGLARMAAALEGIQQHSAMPLLQALLARQDLALCRLAKTVRSKPKLPCPEQVLAWCADPARAPPGALQAYLRDAPDCLRAHLQLQKETFPALLGQLRTAVRLAPPVATPAAHGSAADRPGPDLGAATPQAAGQPTKRPRPEPSATDEPPTPPASKRRRLA